MKTVIICNDIYTQHLTRIGHVESPERYRVIVKALREKGLLTEQNQFSPRKATLEEVSLCHSPTYIQKAQEEILSGRTELSTGDVDVCPQSFEVALYAVGGVVTAVDKVLSGEAQNAFCVVRPPGHHATRDCGMGLCLFNNVAIGAKYIQKKYGVQKVAIIDWDLHHGNGTQDIFETDPSVLYFSTHQKGIYPLTGDASDRGLGEAKGTKINCPITPYLSREQIFAAFQNQLAPALEMFKPEFLFISAGFDAHKNDPLGLLELTDEDFGELTKMVMHFAKTYCQDRLISVLEGGYNLQALQAAACAHVRELEHFLPE